MRTRAVTALSILALSCAATASAGELAGVTLPDQIQIDARTLVLNGMGLREATFLKVDVYVAGLYLEAKSSDAGAILRSDQAKRLVMKFVRAVGRKDIVKAWDEGFKESAGASLPALKDRVATFDSYMSDMANGAVMSFTYLPGSGVKVEVQGVVKGIIAGADFSEALFGIWLGPHPPNPGLKDGLLGRR
jgi:chalcone isomerase-like protein